MRLVTYERNGRTGVGALLPNGKVLSLSDAGQLLGLAYRFTTMIDLIEHQDVAMPLARRLESGPPEEALIDSGDLKLLAPIPRPPRMRSMSSFPAHLSQGQVGRARLLAEQTPDPQAAFEAAKAKFTPRPPPGYYETPVYWLMDHFCVCGPDDEVPWPPYSNWIDYELELAAVIGRAGRDIPKADAQKHIFGYTLLNDLSARDEQALASATSLSITAKGKDFGRSYPMGPCIVTSDEIDVYDLQVTLRVNGVDWAHGSTRDPQWSFADGIAYTSRACDMVPGEIISSATVANCSGLEQIKKGAIGDVVELEAPGIGILRNRIVPYPR